MHTTPVATPPVNVPPAPVNTAPSPPPPPAVNRDSDSDGLTDAEEVLLGTDVQGNDTDGDEYPDQTELLNLYNPVGIAPQRLIDAGIVFAYEHSTDGWELYVPKQWSVVAVDQDQRELRIATTTPEEFMLLRMFENADQLPIATWIARRAAAIEDPCPCTPFTTKRGAAGVRSTKFSMIVWIADAPDRIVEVQYGTVEKSSRPVLRQYPTLFEMIVQSFQIAAR